MLRFGLDEIAGVEPRAGEDVELAEEAERLGHAEALASAASLAHAALAGNPEDPESVDAGTLVAGAQRALEAVRAHDPELAALTDRIGEVGILLRDVAGDLAGYADDLDADPLRLAAVEERRAALTGLTRKYGQDISAVLAWAEESAARLTDLDGDDERIEELTAERDRLRAELGGLAQDPLPGAHRGRGALRGRRHRGARLPRHAARARVVRHPADGGPGRRRGRRAHGRPRTVGRRRGGAAARPAPRRAAPAHRQGRLRR
ncbi:hypothetical protein SHIRM173S_05567 [Streptomyces hirsutus]